MRRFANIHHNQIEEEEEDSSSFLVKLSEDTTPFHPQEEHHADEMQIEEDEVKVLDITEEEINQIYARLPPISSKSDDKKDFHMREESLKPNIKHVVAKKFPPQEENEPQKEEFNSNEDLTVLRYSPENSVEMATHITITFSHPMIPISTLDQISQLQVPVEITPKVEGKFRYVGTKTILFEPTYRFPMSSIFTVEVPKGTKSILGNELKESFAFKFTTSPPSLKRNRTIGNSRKPFLFAQFDQDISPLKFISHIKARSNDDQPLNINFRLVEEKDFLNHKDEKSIRALIKSAAKNRYLLFAIDNDQDQFPLDSNISIVFPADLPSEEGELKTTSEQKFSFRTHGPFTFTSKSEDVHPGDQWTLYFSNPLDEEVDVNELISIHPHLDDVQITWANSFINIKGKSQGKTTYTVEVKKELRDIFQQTLNENLEVKITVKEAKTHLYAFVQDQIIFMKPEPGVHFSVIAVNLEKIDVTFFQVNPDDVLNVQHNQWRKYDNMLTWENIKVGKKIESLSLPIQNYQPDTPIEVKIPLAPALAFPDENLGHVALCITTPEGTEEKVVIYAYIQVTNIGLSAFQLDDKITLWANDFSTNKPISDLKVETLPFFSGTTDQLGLVNYPYRGDPQPWVRASLGNDHLTYQLNAYSYNNDLDRFFTHVIDDRRLYKPKEEVNISGWVRKSPKGSTYLVHQIPTDMKIDYSVRDSRSVEITKGTVELNSFGSFSLKFTLPDNVNLGHTSISFSNEQLRYNHYHSFQIEEFRTPEFTIKVSSDPSPKYANSNTVVSVSASYFSGGGLDDSEVTWNTSGSESSYSPPHWGEYNFSPNNDYFRPYIYPPSKQIKSSSIKSKTDSNGNNEILVSFEGSTEPPKPVTVNVEAVVMDINRQTVSGSSSFIVHPSRYYVGVKVNKKIVQSEEKSSFNLIVTDINGTAIPDVDIHLSVHQFVEKIRNGKQYDEKEEKFTHTIKSQREPTLLEVPLSETGSYSITCRIKDNFGNEVYSVSNFWVVGESAGTSRRAEHLEIISDKSEYFVGDEITLMVRSPLIQTKGWAHTIARTIVDRKPFELEDGQSTYVFKHKVGEEEVPSIVFTFEIIGYKVGANEKLIPSYLSGSYNAPISLKTRELTVDLLPQKKILSPGEETTISVNVQTSSSLPVDNAEVLLIVVDEAILSLTPEMGSNDAFIRSFYQSINSYLSRYDNRGQYFNPDWNLIHFMRPVVMMRRMMFARGAMLCNNSMQESCLVSTASCSAPMPMMMMRDCSMMMDEEAGGCGGGGGGGNGPAIAVRSNFNPLALFASNLVTDKSGKASATFTLPDSLTSYRVIAFTTHDAKYFGKSEASIQVRLPLMIRPSLPRFLNFGDDSDLPLVIQNQSEESIEAKLVIRTSNLQVTSVRGVKLNIPPNKRTEFRFKAKTENVGLARLQFGITSSNYSDAIEKEFNVWTPATTEGFATYGEIDGNPDSLLQLVTKPRGVFPQFGGLSISLSSTALQGLFDAIEYIVHYPFECTEQIASRLITLISTKDIFQAFNSPKLPSADQVKEIISSSIKLLQKRQNSNGGFGWWNTEKTDCFLSIFVSLALSRYHREDYFVDQTTSSMINKAKDFLNNLPNYFDIHYSESTKLYLTAFSFYILSTFGDDVAEKATNLYNNNKEKLSLEVLGWILLSVPYQSPIVGDILRYLYNRLNETAETANFVSQYSDQSEERHVLLCSNLKTDAILLEALIKCDPSNSVIAKLVKGVLATRKKGRWYNTQDNCFALISILAYFRTFESVEPNFNAKVWIDQSFAGSQQFKGRSVDTHLIEIPMDFILQQKEEENGLALAKEGEGRLYYRIGLDYALTSFELNPLSAGFAISRTYSSVDHADDVKFEDGVWTIKSGARVKVSLSLFNQSQRFHVAMVDKLPAGFEVLNPALKTTEKLPNAEQPILYGCYWFRNWFDHQNIRDERVEAFATYLYPGVHEFSYYARATTHGSFIAPPAKVEEMYSPEVFGRFKNEKVLVV